MRVFLNVSVVLVCGALAGLSSLIQSAPTRAAILPVSLAAVSHSVTPEPPGSVVMASRHRSGGIEAHFAAANTAHDGHLTRMQAEQDGWPRVVKHFDEIDADHRGWISIDQIHAFNRVQRAHRRASPA